MTVHPQIEAYLSRQAAAVPPEPGEPSAQAARELHRRTAANRGPGRVIGQLRDFTVGAVPCRLYHPEGDGPFPLLVFLHGGGWIGGDLDTHDALCRELVHGGRYAVVAADYRLAPEHKFPAALEDPIDVVETCPGHGAAPGADPSKVAVGGDSAGGNLAAAAVQHLRHRPGPRPMFQLLIYPATDLRLGRPVYGGAAVSPTLPVEAMAWCVGQYLATPDEALDPRASPVLAEDLRDLPPTFLVTAEHDVLRDDGEAYGLALIRAGNLVRPLRYHGAVHGFLSLPLDIAPS